MSNQSPVRIILANRPRLFRELLQLALEGMSKQAACPFKIAAVTDRVPAATQLQDVDWLIVDEDTAASAVKVASANPDLKVLSLEGRGHRLQLLAATSPVRWETLADSPSLDELVNFLREVTPALQSEV